MSTENAPQKVIRWVGADHSINYSDGRFQPRDGVVYVRQDLALAVVETADDVKQQVEAVIQRHLDSITEARKDTTGLGMIQHIIKMILAEVRSLCSLLLLPLTNR